ncbi:YbaB/EbfC family nucleoid-associated protein [Plantactinospora sonchi]|uniref:YbaB/EbfC family nucleoid-associated protein n=1 Tax=Plantactinospora sonchi TaxID=1544735 RepID=A0ABU7S023_9ACTN
MTAEDPLEKLARLRDQADSLAQKADAAQVAARTTGGTDSTGSVTVTIDAAGRVRDVQVDRAWRNRLGATGLPAALQEATARANANRLEAWSTAFVEQDELPDPTARPMPLGHETFAYQLDELATAPMNSYRGQAALEELLAMLEAVERGIDQVSEQMQAQLSTTFEGRSPSGHVTVTVTGDGAVTDIRYSQQWLTVAGERAIGAETTDAFEAAYRRTRGHTITDLIDQSPLGRLQDLAQDPLGLARRLYLRDD